MSLRMSLVGAIVLALMASTGWTAAAQNGKSPATQVVTLKVTGMTCGGCEAAVQHAARNVDGVTAVKANSDKGIAEVTYDPAKTTPAAIAKVISEKSGFKAEAPSTATNKK
ncbi:MAG: heavy-metal-associated domain-containing protein [Acidobacteria bacterium]|nr:heavy-metal-associated domain-containing protein [Acidobacteriota bacterium]